MPAEAGIQTWGGIEHAIMDSRFRGNDGEKASELFIVFPTQDARCLRGQKLIALE